LPPTAPRSPKLWAFFGSQGVIEPGKVYGDIAQDTARVLYATAMTTRPGTSPMRRSAIASTGSPRPCGGTPRPADDQIWFRKEFGTGLALLRLRRTPDRGLRRPFGSVDVLESALRLPVVEDGTMPAHSAASGHRWTVALILSALIPALTY
jgi:hypothetical protein